MQSPVWGPFNGPMDAAENLSKFTDLSGGPGPGVVWLNGGKMYALRKPRYDANGEGEIVAFEFGPVPPPVKAPARSATGVHGWFSWLGREISKGEAVVGRVVHAAEGKVVHMWRTNFGMTSKQSDGVGVALDVVGVGLSLALMSFGPLEVVGLVALVGGVALLVADGAAYATELAGYDKTAESIKHITFWPRCFATAMTLPDAAWGVGKVLADSAEMAARAASSLSTADRAAADAARVTKGARGADAAVAAKQASLSQRYAEIGAAAQRRAHLRQVRMVRFMSAQAGVRAVIPPGIVFLTKEATDEPEKRAETQETLKRYTIHVSAVRRK